jgi:hypothetical protein
VSGIEGLIAAYASFVQLPWDRALSGAEKTWFALYDPKEERRLRLRLSAFENATHEAHHHWIHLDITPLFAAWMANHEYREEYFAEPQFMSPALNKFVQLVADRIIRTLTQPEVDADTVVALSGLASLFGLVESTSEIFKKVSPFIRGRMLVFFPGQHHGSTYRFLDARDGWNYLAIPITGTEEK